MRRLVAVLLLLTFPVGCRGAATPTVIVPGRDAPFPATWTPTVQPQHTATATLVVQPTPTWDGTPPPPSEAYVPRRSADQLYRAYENVDEWTVVDVRTLAAFEQAHIPGAVHLPLEELDERIDELDGNKTIVFYCLSPNDAMSLQAAMELYAAGFSKVAILDGGIQEWYSDGYPIQGTLLTPTPRVGPPWTVTPLATTPLATTPLATTPLATTPLATTPLATTAEPSLTATSTPAAAEETPTGAATSTPTS